MAKAERLPSGNYRVRVYVGSSMVDGKRVRRYETFTGPDKRDVELQAAQFSAANTGRTDDITFEEALSGYIASKENILSPSTVLGYRRMERNHFKEIKHKRLSRITQKDVQAMINTCAIRLSPKSCQNIHGLFSAVMRMYAPERSFYTKLPQREKKEVFIPSADDIRTIAECLKGNKLELPFMLATQLGLRASEIAGLTKNCVDKKKKTITIKQAMVEGEGGTAIKAPKSYSGYRVLRCNDALLNRVLSSPIGTGGTIGMTAHHISMYWNREIDKIPVTHFGFHKLRHYFASQAMLQGVPLRYLAELMGHTGTQMLEQVYLHTFPSEKEKYSAQMADFFAENIE